MDSPSLVFLPMHRRPSTDSTQSFETAPSTHRSVAPDSPADPVLMARLKALNLSSIPPHRRNTPLSPQKPPSPISPPRSRSPSLNRRSVHSNASSASASEKPKVPAPANPPASIHDLPPLSPLSSMYDPHSPSVSASDEDTASSSSASSNSDDAATLTHTQSMCDHRLRRTSILHPHVAAAPSSRNRFHPRNSQTPFRKALSHRLHAPADLPAPLRHRFSLDTRSNPLSAAVARSRAVDHITPFRNHSERLAPAARMHSTASTRNFDLPRGKVEHLPAVTRPATPSRLPRPKVFIRQSPSRSTVVDPVAVRHFDHHPHISLEPQLVTRELPVSPLPTPPHSSLSHQKLDDFVNHNQFSAEITNVSEEHMYYSDEDEFDSQLVDQPNSPLRDNSPSDVLSNKVRRAVSALRSISFQSTQIEDFDTAWGQALSVSQEKANPSLASLASAKWRRARGMVSGRMSAKEFECYSENDACSMRSSGSNFSSQKGRSMNGRDNVRGFAAMRMRNLSGPHKRSLWAGARRERERQPHAVAAQLLVSGGHGLLAASAELSEQRQALATVAPADAVDAKNATQKGSVDKYVEFIHASAQREAKGKFGPKHFPGRVLRLLRRKWN